MNRETLKENRTIIVFLVILAIILILAAVGYFSGAWEVQ